jgi:hypothetical protein
MLLLLAGLVPACGRHVLISQPGMTCVEAYRLAAQTVTRMGYVVGETVRPTPGTPGLIVASRGGGQEAPSMLVTVTCTRLGADIAASAEEAGLMTASASEFKRTFQAVVANRPPPRAPASSGLDVLLTPEPDAAGLGADLGRAGVLAVRMRLSNQTPRLYDFRVRDVSLRTTSGEVVSPLSKSDVIARFPAGSIVVEQQGLRDQKLAPGTDVSGYLFFPLDTYTRARVELVDTESDEAEGFAIDF